MWGDFLGLENCGEKGLGEGGFSSFKQSKNRSQALVAVIASLLVLGRIFQIKVNAGLI